MRAALPLLAGVFLISGCTYYEPAPTVVYSAPSPYYAGPAYPAATATGPVACDGPYLQDYYEHPPLSSCEPNRLVRVGP